MSDRANASWLQDGPTAAKAEPTISDGGSTSEVTYLRRGKSYCTTATAAGKRSERDYEGNSLADSNRSLQKQGRRCSRRRSL